MGAHSQSMTKGPRCVQQWREGPLMEAMRHQVQGQVIKWRYFCQLEKSLQSSAELLCSVTWKDDLREGKNRLCDNRDAQPAHACSSHLLQYQQPSDYTTWNSAQPSPSQPVDPQTKKKNQRGQSLLLLQAPHFVIKQSLTGAELNKLWIVVITTNYKTPYLSCMRN